MTVITRRCNGRIDWLGTALRLWTAVAAINILVAVAYLATHLPK